MSSYKMAKTCISEQARPQNPDLLRPTSTYELQHTSIKHTLCKTMHWLVIKLKKINPVYNIHRSCLKHAGFATVNNCVNNGYILKNGWKPDT